MPVTRICFDISAGLSQTAGIGRYARELARALAALPDGPQLALFHNRQSLDRLPPELSGLPRAEAPLSDKAWRAFVLSGLPLPNRWLNPGSFDMFHGADVIAPAMAKPIVITIHDLSTLLFPQHHTRLHGWFDRLSLPRMARRASAIIADSEATRQDIIRLLHVAPDHVHSIHLGVDHQRFRPRDPLEARAIVRDSLNIAVSYILAVGTLEPRKNLGGLLRAYALLPPDRPRLVLAGARGWGDNAIFELARQLGLLDAVQFAGYVPEGVLPSLYAGALGFVYPSLYEGFGLPVLEAMACGAPVITSNVSSLPEVAGDACLLVNPSDSGELAHAIRRLVDDASVRDGLRARGFKQAAGFGWERTARETCNVYHIVRRQASPLLRRKP